MLFRSQALRETFLVHFGQCGRGEEVGVAFAEQVAVAAQAETAAPPPELVPVSMPVAPVSWSQMEGHLHGRVLLHVSIDGNGRVADATLAASSGDAVLDAHALATVRGWRFAVPADHPDGFSGDLPMRFTSGPQQVAQAP